MWNVERIKAEMLCDVLFKCFSLFLSLWMSAVDPMHAVSQHILRIRSNYASVHVRIHKWIACLLTFVYKNSYYIM